MRKKTRQYIHKAEREGVITEETRDLDRFLAVLAKVAARDRFAVHDRGYFERLLAAFGDAAHLTMSRVGAEDDGALLAVQIGDRAWELYGGWSGAHGESRPFYLLKWRSLMGMKQRGVARYDMWGLSEHAGDELAGIENFKLGFGGEVATWIGAFDRPVTSRRCTRCGGSPAGAASPPPHDDRRARGLGRCRGTRAGWPRHAVERVGRDPRGSGLDGGVPSARRRARAGPLAAAARRHALRLLPARPGRVDGAAARRAAGARRAREGDAGRARAEGRSRAHRGRRRGRPDRGRIPDRARYPTGRGDPRAPARQGSGRPARRLREGHAVERPAAGEARRRGVSRDDRR